MAGGGLPAATGRRVSARAGSGTARRPGRSRSGATRGANWSCVEYGRLRRWPPVHQGGRAAAVEVDRALRAERRPSPRRARASRGRRRRASGGRHRRRRRRSRLATPSAARGCRPSVMSESNCPAPGREALAVVVPVEDDLAARDEQRPGLDEVSRRRRRRVLARDEVDAPRPSTATHARRAAYGAGIGSWSHRAARRSRARRAGDRGLARRSRRRSPRRRRSRCTRRPGAPCGGSAPRAPASPGAGA